MEQLQKDATDVLHKNDLRIDKSYNVEIGIEKWSPNQMDDGAVIIKVAEDTKLTFRLGVKIERSDHNHRKQTVRCSKSDCTFTTKSINDLAAHYYLHFFDGDCFTHNCCGDDFTTFQEFCFHYNNKHKDIKAIHLNVQECDAQMGENLSFKINLKKVKLKNIIKDAFKVAKSFDKHFEVYWNSYDFIHSLIRQIGTGMINKTAYFLQISINSETRRAAIRRSSTQMEESQESKHSSTQNLTDGKCKEEAQELKHSSIQNLSDGKCKEEAQELKDSSIQNLSDGKCKEEAQESKHSSIQNLTDGKCKEEAQELKHSSVQNLTDGKCKEEAQELKHSSIQNLTDGKCKKEAQELKHSSIQNLTDGKCKEEAQELKHYSIQNLSDGKCKEEAQELKHSTVQNLTDGKCKEESQELKHSSIQNLTDGKCKEEAQELKHSSIQNLSYGKCKEEAQELKHSSVQNLTDECFMNQQRKVDELDKTFRGNVTSIVGTFANFEPTTENKPYFIIGGSIVEGAAICRYFQPKEDGGNVSKNREVEVDINLVVGDIPSRMKSLVQEIPEKPINVKIRSNEELLSLLSDKHKLYFQSDDAFINSYRIKEAASRTIEFAKEESWLKQLIALTKNKDVDQINFSIYGEYVKPTAATDVMVEVDDEEYVNISLDLSVMFKIGWVPSILNEWVGRKRVWPPKEKIEDLLNHCYVISKPSDKEKDNFHTEELSYSFHHLEARLANLRSDEQRMIYSMSKSIVYKYVKPLHPDIPSFYPKTIMLWTQEEYAPDDELWKDPILALKHLMSKLRLGVESEKISYYFVPRFNIVKPLPPIIKSEIVNRLKDLEMNIEDRLKLLPVDECLQFYGSIVKDSSRLNEILNMKPGEYQNHPRILQDQFTSLRNKLEGNVCYSSNPFGNSSSTFVGRQNELIEIHSVMSTEETKRAVVVHGLGGYGKSELTRQYLHCYWETSTNKYWLNAESELAIKNGVSELLNALNSDVNNNSGARDVRELMSQTFDILREEDTIMVFDNVVNPNQFCSWVMESRKPTGSNIRILATSQSSTFNKEYFHLIPVQPLPKDITVTFLKNQLEDDQYDEVSANEFCQLIGGHPLSLNVSLAYMKKNQISLNDFDKLIKENDDLIMYKLFPPQYGKALFATLNVAVQNILLSKNTTLIDLLFVSALLDGQELDRTLLLEYKDTEDTVNALKELQNCSLIIEKDDEYCEMHNLIQKVIQFHLGKNNTLIKYIQLVIQMIKSIQKKSISRDHTSFGDPWLHHLLPLIEKYADNNEIMELLEEVKLDIVCAFQNKGQHKDLMEYLNVYLKYETKTCQHLDVIFETRNLYAWSMRNLGEYNAALKVFRELYDECLSEYGEEGENTMRVMMWIAVCLDDLDNLTEARRMYDDLNATRMRVSGESNTETMKVMHNLAICMDKQGEYEKAQQLYEKVIALYKCKFGAEHMLTLTAIGALASCLSDQNKVNESIQLSREVCDTNRKVLGNEHKETLSNLYNLATDLKDKGELDEAKCLYTEVYETRKELLGDSHPDTLEAKGSMADCLSAQGKIDEAIQLKREVCDIQRKVHGNENDYTLGNLYSLAIDLCMNEEFEEGKSLSTEVYETRKKLFGDSHPDTLEAKELNDLILQY